MMTRNDVEPHVPGALSDEEIKLVRFFIEQQTRVVCRAALMSAQDIPPVVGPSRTETSRFMKRIAVFLNFRRHEKLEKALALQKILLDQLSQAIIFVGAPSMDTRASFVKGCFDACTSVGNLNENYGVSATWNIRRICSMLHLDVPAQDHQVEPIAG